MKIKRVAISAIAITGFFTIGVVVDSKESELDRLKKYCESEYKGDIALQTDCFLMQKESLESTVKTLKKAGLLDEDNMLARGQDGTTLMNAARQCFKSSQIPEYDTVDFYRVNQCISGVIEE